ncbi:hypothetical protein EDD11_004904 [Mortierella claussenii]|nr:hypothetical protein EDD11_004904 [Mortierella claussenii]
MLSPQYSGGTSTPASRSRRPSRCSGLHDDDSFCDQESIGDDEAELQAEELMADDLFPQSPPGRVSYDQTRSGLKDTMWQGFAEGVKTMMNNKADHIYRQHHRQSQPLEAQSLVQRQAHLQHRHQRSYSTIDGSRDYYAGRKMEQGALDDIQLQRLISYSMLHKDQREKRPEAGLSAASDRGSKEICSTVARLSQSIPGWSAYRSRQNSSNARHMVREVLDHGGILADCMDEEVVPRSETRKSECSAWKACFGLFWVAAGHWLDDSRLISSYNLQPHCLLELQLRNNYVQLPPPGTSLNYYDHYAEGVLYKMSKKSRPVSKLTSHGSKDLATDGGDTTKKSIELEMPVSVMVTVVPHNPRQCFKLVCNNTSPMSNTMITLTVSPDPTIPKVCFRATSESELNHWVRIFNSLNYATSNGLNPPPMDPTVASWSSPASTPIVLPPPLPPLPLLPPPVSTDDSSNHDIVKKRDRHHSYTGNTNGTVGDHRNGVAGFTAGFTAERRRCHTTQHGPTLMASINPVLISNAAVALSNYQGSVDGDSEYGGSIGGHHRFQRQRTITEVGVPPSAASGSLNRRIRAASFGMNTQRNSRQDLMQEHLERLRAATPEPWTKAKQEMDVSVLNTLENMTPLNLDPGSQALFNASSAQCSGPPLFSGYVWLYIPNSATTLSQSSQGPNAAQKSIGSSIPTLSTSALFPTGDVAGHNAPTLSKRSSCSSILSTSTEQRSVSNICITKASGRFVKCFAVINQMGHFQWLEVDENEPQQQQQQQQQQHSNSSHGIRLSPQQKTNGDPIEASVPSLKCVKEVGTQGQKSGDQANSTVTTPRPVKAGGVKACVAHKMRLHFFCINIALSSLPDTIMEPPVPPQPSSSVFSAPSSVSECSSRRGHQSRFSAPLTHQKTLSLNPPVIPMRVTSLQRLATQTSGQGQLPSYKFPLDETKPLWPSMSLVHERSQSAAVPQTVHIPTPPPERALSKTFAALKSRSSASLTSSLSGSGPGSDDASVDDAPLAVSALLPNAHVARSLLTKTQSLFIENRGRTRSAPPAGSNVLSKLGRSRLMATHTQDDVSGHETDLMKRHTSQLLLSNTRRGTLYPSAEEVAANAGATEVAAAKASDTVAAPSQILSLAEQLQKTMQQVRGENQDPNHHGYERSSGNDENVTDEVSGRESTKSQVPSLQEITAKKRESAQRMKNSANVEAARLKLVGGHVDVQAEQQPGDTKARWPSQVRKRNAEVMDRKRIGEVSQQQQQQQLPPALRMLLTQCPFLEQSEILRDAEGERVVTLKGYTETEEAWKALQSALERFVDGPVKDQRSALPPEETLIPSYHAPRLPEVRLSEKARSFLKAKDRRASIIK